MGSSLSEGTTVQQRFTREAGAYTTSVVAASSKLSDAYLKTLTTAFVVDNWSLFFSSYGTHVTTEVTVGARYSQVTTFERTKVEELQSNEAAYNVGIKASYDGATGSVDASHSHSSTDRSMVENSSTRQFIVSNGGDGATLDANTTETTKMYQVAAHNYPSPLRATLIPHEILITVSKWSEFKDALIKYYPDDEKAKSVTTQDFESAWVTAIGKYCGDDAHKCSSVSSFAAPEKMTLTTMHFDSPVWGQHQDGNVVSWPNMPDFQAYKAMIKISAIRTFCSRVSHGRSRFRGLQFNTLTETDLRRPAFLAPREILILVLEKNGTPNLTKSRTVKLSLELTSLLVPILTESGSSSKARKISRQGELGVVILPPR